MIEYTRCHPEGYLALCGHCYRYIRDTSRGVVYYDHYRVCDGGKYGEYLNSEDWYRGTDILERLRHVQVQEGKEKTVVVQGEELVDTEIQQEPGIQDVSGR